MCNPFHTHVNDTVMHHFIHSNRRWTVSLLPVSILGLILLAFLPAHGLSLRFNHLTSQQVLLSSLMYLLPWYEDSSKNQTIKNSNGEGEIQSFKLLCENKQYAWFKDCHGLTRMNKFNGKQWKIKSVSFQHPMVDITCGVCYDNGQTYIGTNQGILFWDNYSLLILSTENTTLPENHITNLSIIPGDDLLIETKNFGRYLGVGRDIKVYKLKKISHHPTK